MTKYESYNHAKTRLRYHFIFSTKYRRKCLNEIKDVVLNGMKYAESKSHFKILNMEIDKDHIHLLIKFPPAYSIDQTVKRLKQLSTQFVYNDMNAYIHLKKYYWKNKKVLWTHGYFCSTIGDVSEKNIINYIENQS